MSDKYATIWKMDPHTKAKHDLLVRYLGGWFPVLGRFNGRVVFLDGFAGPGRYSGDQPGSPILALRTLIDHQHNGLENCEFLFIFNEKDPARFRSLQEEIEEQKGQAWPKHVKVSLVNDNFSTVAARMIDYLGAAGASLAPTFAFLDPFGYKDVPMSLIASLLAYNKCELFIYFDYNSVNRFGTAGMAVDQHFKALFGSDQYQLAPSAGDPHRKAFFHDLYMNQLRTVCNFPYVQSFEMLNKQGRTGHFLFYCTRSLKGLEIMKEAMWKVAPGGDFKFSDTLAGQTVLFQEDVDTSPLQASLARHFSGKTVGIGEVEVYTLVSTPYAKNHVKTRTLRPMQKEGRITCPNQKRSGYFPDGTMISFP